MICWPCPLIVEKQINSKIDVNIVVLFMIRSTLVLTFGGMCMLPQHRGGACFCTRGAMQGYAVITLFSRWQKP